MKISELLENFSLDIKLVGDLAEDLEIKSITDDSRQVTSGSLFVAVRGVEQNGEEYIEKAISAGAIAVLTLPDVEISKKVVHIIADNERQALAKIANYFYPSDGLRTVAVTGTNGKTSVAEFFRQLVELQGDNSVSIGTMGLGTDSLKGFDVPAINTSPGPVLLHKTLHELSKKGVDSVALEASSHGLHQHRMDGLYLTAAAFVNLTRDHLDYHKTEKAYFDAKLRLFAYVLPKGSVAVLNKDDKYFSDIKKMCDLRKHEIVSFGKDESADLILRKITRTPNGMNVRFRLNGQAVETSLPLIGEFQVMNILAALGLAEACGYDMLDLTNSLRLLKPVRGRMERVSDGIYVDYAHTPDALEKALKTMRLHVKGRLGVVIGCGGDRDAGKRVPMGRIASDLSDFAFITDDNPRHENADEIRMQVMAGAQGDHCKEIADRRAAIKAAINELSDGDMLLVAGKGHETYQIIGDDILDFDDAEIVREFIK